MYSTAPNRRTFLQQTALLPLAFPKPAGACHIIAEPGCCLSQESAEGYKGLLETRSHASLTADLIIVPGAGPLAQQRLGELRARVRQGAWMIWEPAPLSFAHTETTYIRYCWPTSILVRRFGDLVPMIAGAGEAIAHDYRQAVSFRRRLGRGCMIHLGTMLGPLLRAEDREAAALVRALLAVRS
jgi:hypothetical protein